MQFDRKRHRRMDIIVDVAPVERPHVSEMPDWQLGATPATGAVAPRSLMSRSSNASTEMPCRQAGSARAGSWALCQGYGPRTQVRL